MKNYLILLLCGFASLQTFAIADNNVKIIELGKAYKDFMFRNDPPKSFMRGLVKDASDDLKATAQFISETINPKSKILSDKYLKLPEALTLKEIYIVKQVSLNLQVENPEDNNTLVESLKGASINHYELVDNYYSMLFTSVGNKLGLEKLDDMDFQLKSLNLKDDTEMGIFFLRCLNACGNSIWGYMNVAKPKDTKKALNLIRKFPMFNNLRYYQYTDFYFSDFKMNIDGEEGLDSYKEHFIDKYFETLIYHLICLNAEGADVAEINDLLLGSIMKESNLYKYTEHDAVLESIFQKR